MASACLRILHWVCVADCVDSCQLVHWFMQYRSDLDMLAGVVVEGTVQPKGRGKRAARAVHSPNGRGQSFLDTFQRADEGAHFMTLPIGWRMEVVYERVAGGKGVAVETVYVSPNRTRFKSMAEVVTWLTSSSNRARLLAGVLPT